MRFLIAGLGVLMFAVVTAILFVWGLRKSYFRQETLSNMLFSKSAHKVMHYLKSHDTISEVQMRKLVDGTEASEAFSRNKAIVKGDKEFTVHLIELMKKDGMIEAADQDGTVVYRKKQKSKR